MHNVITLKNIQEQMNKYLKHNYKKKVAEKSRIVGQVVVGN